MITDLSINVRALTLCEVIHTPSSGNLLKELVSRLSVSNVRFKTYHIAQEKNQRDDMNGCKPNTAKR